MLALVLFICAAGSTSAGELSADAPVNQPPDAGGVNPELDKAQEATRDALQNNFGTINEKAQSTGQAVQGFSDGVRPKLEAASAEVAKLGEEQQTLLGKMQANAGKFNGLGSSVQKEFTNVADYALNPVQQAAGEWTKKVPHHEEGPGAEIDEAQQKASVAELAKGVPKFLDETSLPEDAEAGGGGAVGAGEPVEGAFVAGPEGRGGGEVATHRDMSAHQEVSSTMTQPSTAVDEVLAEKDLQIMELQKELAAKTLAEKENAIVELKHERVAKRNQKIEKLRQQLAERDHGGLQPDHPQHVNQFLQKQQSQRAGGSEVAAEEEDLFQQTHQPVESKVAAHRRTQHQSSARPRKQRRGPQSTNSRSQQLARASFAEASREVPAPQSLPEGVGELLRATSYAIRVAAETLSEQAHLKAASTSQSK